MEIRSINRVNTNHNPSFGLQLSKPLKDLLIHNAEHLKEIGDSQGLKAIDSFVKTAKEILPEGKMHHGMIEGVMGHNGVYSPSTPLTKVFFDYNNWHIHMDTYRKDGDELHIIPKIKTRLEDWTNKLLEFKKTVVDDKERFYAAKSIQDSFEEMAGKENFPLKHNWDSIEIERDWGLD